MKEVGGDTMIIGAMLSELASNKLIKISNTKIGGTPTYYAPGQEPKLETLISHLNSKDRETVTILKENKVLKDEEQSPLIRVSLRNIKDFARKIEVNLSTGPVVFWRYYMIPEQEAVGMIKHQLGLDKPKEEPKHVETPKHIEAPKPVIVEENPFDEKTIEAPAPKTATKAKPTRAPSKPRKPTEAKPTIQTPLPGNIETEDTEFYSSVQKYFETNLISVLSSKILTKKTQYEYTIQIPSHVGTLAYYCVARDKKAINEGDISNAYILGQKKGMPILYLTTGALTKKAQALLTTEFRSMTVKNI
jgi:hypothetical protein